MCKLVTASELNETLKFLELSNQMVWIVIAALVLAIMFFAVIGIRGLLHYGNLGKAQTILCFVMIALFILIIINLRLDMNDTKDKEIVEAQYKETEIVILEIKSHIDEIKEVNLDYITEDYLSVDKEDFVKIVANKYVNESKTNEDSPTYHFAVQNA